MFRKDLRVELRTRYAVGAVLLFAVTTLIAVSAALSAATVKSEVKAALLWIVLLFAALSGLARVFVREEEAGTAPLLRLYAPATAVYAGKWLFNIALVFSVELVSVPLFLVVLPLEHGNVGVNFGLLAGVLILGGVGLSGASTFVAALIAQASSGKSALFFVVAFPILLPLLLIAVQGTIGTFDGLPSHIAKSRVDIEILAVYSLVMTTASFLLFEYVWND
ncbi:MAG: heme exporter protein CcmB [Janthinobacterium lividum]